MKNKHQDLSNETLAPLETIALDGVQGGFWPAAAVSAGVLAASSGFAKGLKKDDRRPGESAKDLIDPTNKANWPRVLPVVGGVYSAGRLLYKAGEAVGRS